MSRRDGMVLHRRRSLQASSRRCRRSSCGLLPGVRCRQPQPASAITPASKTWASVSCSKRVRSRSRSPATSGRTRSSNASSWTASSRSSAKSQGTLPEHISESAARHAIAALRVHVPRSMARPLATTESSDPVPDSTADPHRAGIRNFAPTSPSAKASRADREGNLVYRMTARNFKPLNGGSRDGARALEVEEIVATSRPRHAHDLAPRFSYVLPHRHRPSIETENRFIERSI